MLELNRIYLGDCLEIMKKIDDKSIDMILCDLPYGTTKCKWDITISLDRLWEQYERIIKDNGAIVLTASQPFTSTLVMSNLKMFKYEWVWNKIKPTGFQMANYRPMKVHENILVFGKSPATYVKNKISMKYNPQGVEDCKRLIKATKKSIAANNGGDTTKTYVSTKKGFPNSILSVHNKDKTRLHETQKPEELYEYLIKTYSDKGDLILDNCCGSGTIGVAETIGRNFIGIEKDERYYKIACKRAKEFTS